MDETNDPANYLYRKCTNCRVSFNVKHLPNMPRCEHLICDFCYEQRCCYERNTYCCFICREFFDISETDLATQGLRGEFKKLARLCRGMKQIRVEKKRSEEEVDETTEKRKMMIGDVKCSECERSDNETSIQVCDTCMTQKFETCENFIEKVLSNDVNFDSIAICPLCAIRSHMKKGHEVTDFYPILRKFQFDNHCENLKPKRENNQQENEKLKQEMDEVMVVIGEGEEELNKMSEMMGRCKSSALQKCLATKITQQIESNSGYVEKFREVVANFGKKMKATNNKLKEENNAENVKNCDEEELAGVN